MNINYYNVYNGTNHELYMYDEQDVYTTRKDADNNVYYRNPNAGCRYYYKQQTPLKAKEDSYCEQALYCRQTLDFLPYYYEYDTIVVSSRYARVALAQYWQINPQYLDRLYTPIKVYDNENDKTVIGTRGLYKVVVPQNVMTYYDMICWPSKYGGVRPSSSAIEVAVECAKYNPYINNDPDSVRCINSLNVYLRHDPYEWWSEWQKAWWGNGFAV